MCIQSSSLFRARIDHIAGLLYLYIYLPQRLSESHLADTLRYLLLDTRLSITVHAYIAPGTDSA
jgi:hypothetical protein